MKTKRTRYTYGASHKPQHMQSKKSQKSKKHANALAMPRLSIVLTMTFLLILGIVSTTFSAFISNSDVLSSQSNGGLVASVQTTAVNQGSNISINHSDKTDIANTGAVTDNAQTSANVDVADTGADSYYVCGTMPASNWNNHLAMTKGTDTSNREIWYIGPYSTQYQFKITKGNWDWSRGSGNNSSSTYTNSLTMYEYGSSGNCWPASSSNYYIVYTVSIDKISCVTSLPLKAPDYTVTYNGNGGTPATQTKDTENGKFSFPTTPTRSGYFFKGWYTASSGGTKKTENDTCSSATTLYAQWETGQTVYVALIQNNSDIKNNTSKVHYWNSTDNGDATLTALSLTKYYDPNSKWGSKQKFKIYSAQVPGSATHLKLYTGSTWADEEISLSNASATGKVVLYYDYSGRHNIVDTLYADITWSLNGGSSGGSTANKTSTANYNVTPKFTDTGATANPTKTGYTFSSWSPTPAAITMSNALSSTGVTYTAQWSATSYTITYKDWNGTSSAGTNYSGSTISSPTSYTYGTGCTLPTPTKTGYDFAGWYTTGNGSTTATTVSTTATGDKTFYAKWTEKTYTITYNANAGTDSVTGMPSPNPDTKYYFTAYTISSAVPQRNGYSFTGWKTGATSGTAYASGASYSTNANLTLYAQWEATRNVTVNVNNSSYGSASVTYNSTTKNHTITATPATGYHVASWTKTSGTYTLVNGTLTGTPTTSLEIKATTDVVFNLNFAPDVYSITYKDKGDVQFTGSHPSGYPTTHTYGSATTLKNPTRTGYTFGGWFTTSACTGTAVTSLGATAYTSDITLYAKWTINTYTVQFENNGHGSKPGNQSVNHGSTATNPGNLSETGYIFGGWYANSALTTAFNFNNAITANTTIYAKWTAAQYTITVTSLTEGVTATATPNPVTYPGVVTLHANLPTGYSIDGWNITGTYTPSSGSIDENDYKIIPTSNLTITVSAHEAQKTKVYFMADYNYLYLWEENGSSTKYPLGGWPGTQVTATETFGSYNWYYAGQVEFTPGYSNRVGAIINDGFTIPSGTGSLVMFNNTLGWTQPHLYTKSSSLWNGDNGCTTNGATHYTMTKISGTNYWYAYVSTTTQVLFTKIQQDGYGNIHNNEACYNPSWSSGNQMFTPNTKSNETRYGTMYYSNGTWGAKPSATQSGDIELADTLYDGSTWKSVPAVWIDYAGNVTLRTELIDLISELRTEYNNGINPNNKFTTSSWTAFKNAYTAAVTASGNYNTSSSTYNQTYIDNAKNLLQQKYDELELKTYFESPSSLSLKKIYSTSIDNILNFNTTVILKYGFNAPYTKSIKYSTTNESDGSYVNAQVYTDLDDATHNTSLTYAADTVATGVRFIKVEVEGADGNRRSVLVAKTVFGTSSAQSSGTVYLKASGTVGSDYYVAACFTNGSQERWATMQSMGTGSNKYRVTQPDGYDKVTFYYMYKDKYCNSKAELSPALCYAQSTNDLDITETEKMFTISSVTAGSTSTIGVINGAFGNFS